jgi:4'-phosphopantetheinyl transferase
MSVNGHAVGTFQIWTTWLDDATRDASSTACLSDDERARAARIVSARDRERFLHGRAFLRHVLGRAMGQGASELRFLYGTNGKPLLAFGGEQVSFNLAHAGGLAICLVGHDCGEVGVDVEFVRPLPELHALAKLACGPGERTRFDAEAPSRRTRAFYEMWTRKEAVLKARGTGLSRPLDSIEVTFGEDERPRVIASSDPVDLTMTLTAFEPAPGYVAAAAVSGEAIAAPAGAWHW